MITNEKQHKIALKKLRLLQEQVKDVSIDKELSKLKKEIKLIPLSMLKEDLEKEIKLFEGLKEKKVLKARSLDKLPEILIEYKISKGYTQKDLAGILEIKEQQLQRYEKEKFQSVSFKKLLEFFRKLGISPQIRRLELE